MKLLARPQQCTAARGLSTSASLWIFHRTEIVHGLQGIGLQIKRARPQSRQVKTPYRYCVMLQNQAWGMQEFHLVMSW